MARERDLILHMDGARLFNAVVATQTSAKNFAAPFDTVWVDFSKGLGAPVGAVLAGRRSIIDEAWPWKQRLGGAMRQAGIIAAAAIVSSPRIFEGLEAPPEHGPSPADLAEIERVLDPQDACVGSLDQAD